MKKENGRERCLFVAQRGAYRNAFSPFAFAGKADLRQILLNKPVSGSFYEYALLCDGSNRPPFFPGFVLK
jgi:hypothetical protein